MTSNKALWMPMYVNDYYADTRRLTTLQHGAYLLLIFDYWRNGPPPADDKALRSIVGMNDKEWQENKAVIAKFFTQDGERWTHKRIDQELKRAEQIQANISARAKVANEKRWGSKRSLDDPTRNPTRIVQGALKESNKDRTGDAARIHRRVLGTSTITITITTTRNNYKHNHQQ